MTPIVEDLIDSLKKLIAQMDSLDGKFKNLVNDSHELSKTITMTKEYSHELNVLNNISETQPRTSLIYALQDETKQIVNLENENSELNSTIKNYQQCLDVIMNKYRTHSQGLNSLNQKELSYNKSKDDVDYDKHKYLQNQVNEIILVMDKACDLDETKVGTQKELILKLKEESNTVKQYLLMNKLKKMCVASKNIT